MAAICKKLQIQRSCSYGPEQPLPLYGNKEPKLQTSMLGPRALLLSLLH